MLKGTARNTAVDRLKPPMMDVNSRKARRGSAQGRGELRLGIDTGGTFTDLTLSVNGPDLGT